MPPDLIKELKKAFRNFGENIEKYGASIGKATLGCEVKIVDKNRNDAPVNTVGEIVVKGAHVTGGYYKDPESTAKSFKDGEFFTGDLGHVDDKGFFYVSSRKTDVVNRGGENVYLVEVENTICLHPKVLEIAVFGVKDDVMGEKVACAIVPVPGGIVNAGRDPGVLFGQACPTQNTGIFSLHRCAAQESGWESIKKETTI